MFARYPWLTQTYQENTHDQITSLITASLRLLLLDDLVMMGTSWAVRQRPCRLQAWLWDCQTIHWIFLLVFVKSLSLWLVIDVETMQFTRKLQVYSVETKTNKLTKDIMFPRYRFLDNISTGAVRTMLSGTRVDKEDGSEYYSAP
jgi:hypothetical protein